jgi:hypothetical protein
MRRLAASILVACLLVISRSVGAADTAVAEPAAPAVAPADALAHAGEECTVEFTVEAARKLPGKEVCFLNSCRDHRDEQNFTVVIFKGGLERLKADGIESPAEHFAKATIRVRGVVEKRDGRPQIVVDEPGQITVVKAAEPTAAKE